MPHQFGRFEKQCPKCQSGNVTKFYKVGYRSKKDTITEEWFYCVNCMHKSEPTVNTDEQVEAEWTVRIWDELSAIAHIEKLEAELKQLREQTR